MGIATQYFFHNSASTRRTRNKINYLKRVDNTLIAEQKEIEKMVSEYYTSLFSTQHPTMDNIYVITDLLHTVVTLDINDQLSIPFSKEEIKKALFDLIPPKSQALKDS